MRRLLHFVSLTGPGGVERHLVEFVGRAARIRPGLAHAVLAAGGRVDPDIEAALGAALIGHEKRLGPIKLPPIPAAVRRASLRRTCARAAPDVVVIWNRPVRSRPLLEAVEPRCWLAWEHGSAWLAEDETRQRAFYGRCPLVVANSAAARRVLALRWDRHERVEVCPNGLRPSLAPAAAPLKAPPSGRLVLGMAGRLVPVKGGALALHALAALIRRGVDAELHVAGDGPCRPALESLAKRLGIASAVVWRGFVRDMAAFYGAVQCLVHPSLHESFGLVCIEAAAYGCPVVTAAVDGLPEVVEDGAAGRCIAPELPVADYVGLGGRLAATPDFVYDPRADALTAPKLVSPAALADAVEALLDARTFAAYSARAAETAREKFDFDAHVEAVLGVVARLDRAGARDGP